MNAPFEISEETQLRMNKYSADVLNKVTELFARPGMPRPTPALSDEDCDSEADLQNRLKLWIAAGFNLIDEINRNGVVTASRDGFEGFIHDDLPVTLKKNGGFNFTAWDEKINEAARGLK